MVQLQHPVLLESWPVLLLCQQTQVAGVLTSAGHLSSTSTLEPIGYWPSDLALVVIGGMDWERAIGALGMSERPTPPERLNRETCDQGRFHHFYHVGCRIFFERET